MTDNLADRRARAAAQFEQMREGIGEIAAARQEARDNGFEIPDDVRQMVNGLRQRLHDAGLPWQTIDATPGLEPLG